LERGGICVPRGALGVLQWARDRHATWSSLSILAARVNSSAWLFSRRPTATTRSKKKRRKKTPKKKKKQSPLQNKTTQQPSKNIAVLDVRNDYEWDAGHFLGAERPNEEAFADTPVGGDDDDVPAPLQGRDPDAPVMMYCTGGIRCDVYSAFLRKKGFKNLYTLEGGVQGYLRARGGAPARARELLGGGGGEEATAASAANAEAESDADTPAFAPDAPQGWRGSLFVFDDRLAVAPAGAPGQLLDAGAVEEERRRLEEEEEQEQEAAAAAASAPPLAPLRAAVPCQVCRSADAVLPHLNCANLDCNDLFLACAACRERLRGCCCGECLSAPARLLRPIKAGGHYRSWTAYASPDAPLAVEDGGGNSSNNELDSDADAGDRSVRTVGHAIATGRRREGRLARRARRREAWKAKHKQAEEEQRRLKEEVRRAVAAREEAMMAGGGGDGGAAESERARRLRELLERRRATTTAA
jgi:predicted sulfurtransferase